MKTSRYSDPLILSILRQAEGGVPVAELCREHGMSNASFSKWRAKFGGMDASMIIQMKSIEDENRRLKKMFAELSMQNELLKEALGKEQTGPLNAARWPELRRRGKGSALRWPAGRSVSARPVIATARG